MMMMMLLYYYAVLVLLLLLVVVSHANSTNNLRGQGGSSVETRIIGGNTVDDSNRFPYFTLLKGRILCGGVLIAPNLVVTAAHCENATTQVRVGAYRFHGNDDDDDDDDSSSVEERIEIDQQIRHPYYDNLSTTNNVHSYDIMIIKLKQRSTKQYVHLNTNPSIPEDCGTQLSSIGFGDISTTQYGAQFPEYLQETNDLRFMNHDICQTRHTGSNTLSDDMLCAIGGTGNGITSPCNGDSGGPLFVKGNTPEEDVVVGTVSWGRGCANSYHPIVYSSMSYLFGWIEETACHIDDDDDLPDYFDCSKYVEVDDDATTTPLPNLEFVTWTVDPTRPLSNCQGDCDDDIDCEGTMICYKSDDLDIPGCSGLNSRRIVDYCIQPP